MEGGIGKLFVFFFNIFQHEARKPMKTGATVRLVRRAMLLFAFCGLSLAVIGWVSGNCPNYGTKSIRCPGAPDAYDNGPCNMSLDWLTGELKINGGRLGAHNINDLNPENGSTITANEYAKCYTEMKCTIGEEKYNGESACMACMAMPLKLIP